MLRVKQPIEAARQRYRDIHALDAIAIPLIPTVGLEAAYRQAADQIMPLKAPAPPGVRTIEGPLFAD